MRIITLLLLTVSLQLSAQKRATSFYPSTEQPRESFEYRIKGGDTLRHGHYQFYYPDGTIYQEGRYKRGQLHGEWVINHPSGAVKQTLPYQKGVLKGTLKEYSPEGALLGEAEYKNDLLNGEVVIYHEN